MTANFYLTGAMVAFNSLGEWHTLEWMPTRKQMRQIRRLAAGGRSYVQRLSPYRRWTYQQALRRKAHR